MIPFKTHTGEDIHGGMNHQKLVFNPLEGSLPGWLTTLNLSTTSFSNVGHTRRNCYAMEILSGDTGQLKTQGLLDLNAEKYSDIRFTLSGMYWTAGSNKVNLHLQISSGSLGISLEQIAGDSTAFIKKSSTGARSQCSRPIVGQQYTSRYQKLFVGIRASRYAYWGLNDQIINAFDFDSITGNLPIRMLFRNDEPTTETMEIGSLEIEGWYQ